MTRDRKIRNVLINEISVGNAMSVKQDGGPGYNRATLVYLDRKKAYDCIGILTDKGCQLESERVSHADSTFTFTVTWMEAGARVKFMPPAGACEACDGMGAIDDETCWHCEGEGTDPIH